MGIDPGTNFMGYAIIKVFGKNQKPELVVSGIVDMIKITDPYIKLQRIFSRTLQVIDSYQPDELAIEAQFYGKNVQSMLKGLLLQLLSKEISPFSNMLHGRLK